MKDIHLSGEQAVISEASKHLHKNGWAIIDNILDPKDADTLYASINDITERQLWYQAIHGDGRYLDETDIKSPAHFTYKMDKFPVCNIPLTNILGGALGDSRRSSFKAALTFGARPEEELEVTHPVREFGNILNAPVVASLMSRVSGFSIPPNSATCFLSRYMPGDYLAVHDDGCSLETGRKLGFVLSMNKYWLPHWGGHTVFLEKEDGAIGQAILPSFNTLLIFKVPIPHLVSAIAPICSRPRYAFTGWFHGEPLGDQ